MSIDDDRASQAFVKVLRVFAVGIAVAMVVAATRGSSLFGIIVLVIMIPVLWGVEYALLGMSPHYPPE